MERIKIKLPQHFSFSTKDKIRVSDLNYANHLGNDAVLSLLHQARLQFLKSFGWTELDVKGRGLIMVDSAIQYKGEGFFGDEIIIEVQPDNPVYFGFDLYYKITRVSDNLEIARAKTGMLFFDYHERKKASVPEGVFETWGIN